MPASNAKVLGAGAALIDILATVDDSFIEKYSGGGKGGMLNVTAEQSEALKARLPEYTHRTGGSSGNTVLALGRLGMGAALLAKTGRDAEGGFFRESFSAAGCVTRSIKYSPTSPTGVCISLVTPDSERTMRTDLGASAELTPSDLLDSDFDGIELLHTEGYLLFNMPFLNALLEKAKSKKIKISFDMSSFEVVRLFRDDIERILEKYVDIVFANEDEAAEFLGSKDFEPENAARKLNEYCSTAAVKLGKAGACIGTRGGSPIRVQSVRVEDPLDTTAAGDFWQAGFIYGLLNGMPLEKCGRIASLLGAEVVKVMGTGIPDSRWETIKEQVENIK